MNDPKVWNLSIRNRFQIWTTIIKIHKNLFLNHDHLFAVFFLSWNYNISTFFVFVLNISKCITNSEKIQPLNEVTALSVYDFPICSSNCLTQKCDLNFCLLSNLELAANRPVNKKYAVSLSLRLEFFCLPLKKCASAHRCDGLQIG